MFWDPLNYLATLILVAIGSLVRHTLLSVFVALRQTLGWVFDVERPPAARAMQPASPPGDAVAAGLLAIGQRDPTFTSTVFLKHVDSLFNTLQSARVQANPGLCNELIAADLAARLVATHQAGSAWLPPSRLLAYEKASIVNASCGPRADEITVRVWSRRLASASHAKPGGEPRSDLLAEDWLFRRAVPIATALSNGATVPRPTVASAPWILEAVNHVSISLGRRRFPPSGSL
jgi:hypothetical protein